MSYQPTPDEQDAYIKELEAQRDQDTIRIDGLLADNERYLKSLRQANDLTESQSKELIATIAEHNETIEGQLEMMRQQDDIIKRYREDNQFLLDLCQRILDDLSIDPLDLSKFNDLRRGD